VVGVVTAEETLRRHLVGWDLDLLGSPWSTPSSCLARVRRREDGSLAVLKVPRVEEERTGSRVLHWWSGDGAARVQSIDDDGTVLVEHALRPDVSLVELARRSSADDGSSDLRATRTLVAVAHRLHGRPRVDVPAGVVPLRRWFRELFVRADQVGGFFARAAAVADVLLDDQRDCRVLHGDVHHENVLWFGPARGWLAIDPKGLEGESTFDYANILTNPDRATMLRPGRFRRHVDAVAAATGIEQARLLRWTLAWCGLSAAWHDPSEVDGRAADVVAVGLLAEQALGLAP
jgi:streptomycin 6-kinase